MISKNKLFQRVERKGNPEIAETVLACKKNDAWLGVGQIISGSRKRIPIVNLDKIEKEAKAGETIVVPGKVLSQGDVTKKLKIVALQFSQSAREKLTKNKIEMITILEEIKKNPEMKGLRMIK